MNLNIVNLNHFYIDYLKGFPELSGVLEHKYFLSKNGGRKYVGIIFSKNQLDYFVPIHKGRDEEKSRSCVYFNATGIRKIKRSKFDIYMISKDRIGNERVEQVLKCAYMIPVCDRDVYAYDISSETDLIQKNNFQNFYNWLKIDSNQRAILKRCSLLYTKKIQKMNGTLSVDDPYYKATDFWLPYPLAEEKCLLWRKSNQ